MEKLYFQDRQVRYNQNQVSQKMEFTTNINKYLKVNEQGFVICSGRTLMKVIQPNYVKEGTKMINEIINELGQKSATAQGLKQVITTAIKFTGTDHKIYLKVEGNKALGFLRTGQKKLFYHDNTGKMRQLNPICVLDIYVNENYQRGGIGKEIFETFLRCENKWPQKLAYDRPSPKLFGFLKKHYGLSKYIPQNNNFVIFDQFFNSVPDTYKSEQPKTQSKSNEYRKSSNRFYKYQNQPESVIVQKPLVQTRQLNKTIGNLTQKQQVMMKREEKIEDSLSLLQKQINRMHIKSPPLIDQGKEYCHPANQVHHMQESASKTDNSKVNAYLNYAPWATTSDPTFRTTSNSYGSYYHRNK